jgi:hypothetical protein
MIVGGQQRFSTTVIWLTELRPGSPLPDCRSGRLAQHPHARYARRNFFEQLHPLSCPNCIRTCSMIADFMHRMCAFLHFGSCFSGFSGFLGRSRRIQSNEPMDILFDVFQNEKNPRNMRNPARWWVNAALTTGNRKPDYRRIFAVTQCS